MVDRHRAVDDIYFFRIFYAVDILAVNYKRFRAPKIPSPLSRQDLFGTAGTPG